MTPSKIKTVTEPALPADEAFGNVIIARLDTAVVEMQALQSQLAARNGQYERDLARLEAEYKADANSLSVQIGQQGRIMQAAEAAIEALKASNIVPLKAAAE